MVGRSGPGFGRDESYREITSEQVPEEKKLDKQTRLRKAS